MERLWQRILTDQARLSLVLLARLRNAPAHIKFNCLNISFAKRGYWDQFLPPLPIHQIWLRLTFSLSDVKRGMKLYYPEYPKECDKINWKKFLGSFQRLRDVGFETLTVVVMKSFVFWDIMPYSPLKIKRSFGETCLIHLQNRRICQLRNHGKTDCKHSLVPVSCLVYPSALKMEATYSSETSTFNELHGVTS
jgi:hypothetical protein